MIISADTLRTHLAYTTWATNRLLAAASELTPEELARDFGTADKCVVGTLAHVFAADRIWMSRVQGRPPVKFITPEDRDLAVLRRDWPVVLAEWKQWAAGLTDDSAPTVISFQDTKGNSYSSPLWQIVLHVVNHGTHHRGQVSGFLRALGKVPPPLDLIAYYRELV
ncbi:MAG: DUF664 domain-containing protein [Bryobacterales bacterium]|nr:DUF664 domain-containing protein [Bryobacterales bacterium]